MPLLSSDLACMGRVACSESIGLLRRPGELTYVCLSHLRRKERRPSNGCFGAFNILVPSKDGNPPSRTPDLPPLRPRPRTAAPRVKPAPRQGKRRTGLLRAAFGRRTSAITAFACCCARRSSSSRAFSACRARGRPRVHAALPRCGLLRCALCGGASRWRAGASGVSRTVHTGESHASGPLRAGGEAAARVMAGAGGSRQREVATGR